MSQQEAETGEGRGGCTSLLISVAAVVGALILIGNTIGFGGFISVAVSVIVSLFVGLIVFMIAGYIFISPEQNEKKKMAGGPPKPPAVSSAYKQSSHTASTSNPLVGRIRIYDRELSQKVKDFQKAAAERPEFSSDDAERVLSQVSEMDQHHEAYQHILIDEAHPDHSVVNQEMNKYRSAISDLLQLRTRELQSGTYGGFDYRQSLRAIEAEVELRSDEFQGLFGQLEEDGHRRDAP